MTRSAQEGVEAHVEVSDDVANQNDCHKLAGIAYRSLTGTEEEEDGIDECQHQETDDDTHDDVEHDNIAQDLACCLIVAFAELDAQECRSAHADHRAKGSCELHHREAQRYSGDCQCSHSLTDEDGVDDVVERRGCHSDDGGRGVLDQQTADGARPELSDG